MTIRPLSRAEVRDVDRRAMDDYGMSGLVLMENAGLGCVRVLLQQGCRGPVMICCGKGNNAGDGFVIARHLDNGGIPVRILLFGQPEELRGDAAGNFAIISRAGLSLSDLSSAPEGQISSELAGAEWVLDALLGTGSTGAPRPPFDRAIRAMNVSPAKKLAIDLPSGLDCDTGLASEPTFRADHTCTFVAPKLGFGNPAAQEYLGQVHVVEIGVPRKLLEVFV